MTSYTVKVDMADKYPDGTPYMFVHEVSVEAETIIEAIKAAEANAAVTWPDSKVIGAFEAAEKAEAK